MTHSGENDDDCILHMYSGVVVTHSNQPVFSINLDHPPIVHDPGGIHHLGEWDTLILVECVKYIVCLHIFISYILSDLGSLGFIDCSLATGSGSSLGSLGSMSGVSIHMAEAVDSDLGSVGSIAQS